MPLWRIAICRWIADGSNRASTFVLRAFLNTVHQRIQVALQTRQRPRHDRAGVVFQYQFRDEDRTVQIRGRPVALTGKENHRTIDARPRFPSSPVSTTGNGSAMFPPIRSSRTSLIVSCSPAFGPDHGGLRVWRLSGVECVAATWVHRVWSNGGSQTAATKPCGSLL